MKSSFPLYSVLLAALIAAAAATPSCRTLDVENNVRNPVSPTLPEKQPRPPSVIVPVEVSPAGPVFIEVERPIYLPETPRPSAPQTAPGKATVEESNRDGIMKPDEFSHAAVVYDYNPDWVYEVYTQPLRATDICLEPGERTTETPFISDSERFILGGGLSIEKGTEAQHVYVKPTDHGLDATLIINTDRRVYRIILRSYKDIHMPLVRWRYFSTGMPFNFARSKALVPDAGSDPFETGRASPLPPPSDNSGTEGAAFPDPRFLSFNYRVTYGLFKKPNWLPRLVYDDGQKTFIVFPREILQKEVPGVFENRKDIVNYRVFENLIIIDKLVEELTVKKGKYEVTIKKKKG